MQLSNSARSLPMKPFRTHFAQEAGKRRLWIHPCSNLDQVSGNTVGEVTDTLDLKAGTRLGRLSKAVGGATLKTLGTVGIAAAAGAAIVATPLIPAALALAATSSVMVAGGSEMLSSSGRQGVYADAARELKAEANRRVDVQA